MNWIKLRKCDDDNRWRKAMLAGFAGCWPETNTPILLTLDKLDQKNLQQTWNKRKTNITDFE